MRDSTSDNHEPRQKSSSAGSLFAETASIEAPSCEHLTELVGGHPYVALHDLRVGYGSMEIIHGIDMMIGKGQSLWPKQPPSAVRSNVSNYF